MAAELRAEFGQLRKDFVGRIEEIFDIMKEGMARSSNVLADVEAETSGLLTDVKTTYLGLLADIDRRVQRMFDVLSERLQSPLQRRNEEPPRTH